MGLTAAGKNTLARRLGPGIARALDIEVDALKMFPTAVKTAPYTAKAGELVLVDATAGNVAITAPSPAALGAGARWGVKLVATGSSHTASVVRAGTETYDGTGAAPTALGAAGGMYVFTSTGANYVITGKI